MIGCPNSEVRSMALAEEALLKRYICVCLEPRARRVGAIDVLPLTEFLTRLWNDAYAT